MEAKKIDHKDRKNMYLCKTCGIAVVSVDRDSGTTPFQIACLTSGCGGLASSFFYSVPPAYIQEANPVIEWYKPTDEEVSGLSKATQEHVKKGGLLMRRVRRDEEDRQPTEARPG